MNEEQSISELIDTYALYRIFQEDNQSLNLSGTCFAVTDRVVVTCLHCIKVFPFDDSDEQVFSLDALHLFKLHDENLFEQNSGDRVSVKKIIIPAKSHDEKLGYEDLAFLILDKPHGKRNLPLIEGVNQSLEGNLNSSQFFALGVPGEGGGKTTTYVSAALSSLEYRKGSDNLLHFQFGAGAPEGFSGGPVVSVSGDTLACLGVSYLGGVLSPMSRAISSDRLIELLEGQGYEVPKLDASRIFSKLNLAESGEGKARQSIKILSKGANATIIGSANEITIKR